MAVLRMSEQMQHIPVLLNEAIEHLIVSKDGIYVDATFGRGSHSRAILNCLSPKGKLIAFDQDLEACLYAEKHFAKDNRFKIIHASFADMQIHLKNESNKIDGILFDLGVSSPQLDNPARGFSFMHSGKLDMRMNNTTGASAAEWLNHIDEKTLADVIWQYGEEKFSRRIARAIVAARNVQPIETTDQLVNIILQVVPRTKPYDKHPATRTFQAIRIVINQELEALNAGLDASLTLLKSGGRLAVISFHSLEDRIVKQFIKLHEKGEVLPRGLPIKGEAFRSRLKSVVKPIKPSAKEINLNPRARSAILRLAEKQL